LQFFVSAPKEEYIIGVDRFATGVLGEDFEIARSVC
jgi:hypothetical protein